MEAPSIPDHLRYGPSSAKRWMVCTMSIRACEGLVGKPRPSADMGTVAHFLLNQSLTPSSAIPCPEDAIGEWYRPTKSESGNAIVVKCDEGDERAVKVTEEMAGHVSAVRDHILDLLGEHPDFVDSNGDLVQGATGESEVRMVLAALDPEFGGTMDYLIVPRDTNTYIDVLDLKYGTYFVDEEDNAQGKSYGLIAWELAGGKHKGVRFTIAQPRCPDNEGRIFRSCIIEAAELKEWREKVAEAIYEEKNSPVYRINSECDPWCLAKKEMKCPAICSVVAKTGGVDDITVPFKGLMNPMDMTPEQIATVIINAHTLEMWIDSVKEFANGKAASGQKFPGLKYVRGRAGNRKWASPDEAAGSLLMTYNEEDIFEKRLRSPSDIEKLLGKDAIECLDDLIVREEGKLSLVPEVPYKRPLRKKRLAENNASGFTDATTSKE